MTRYLWIVGFALVASSLVGVAIQAADLKQLGGKTEVTYGFFNHEAPSGDTDKTADSLSLYISGSAARDIYQAMPAKAALGCDQDVTHSKTAGGLTCVDEGDGSYECSVGILLKSGKTTNASVC
jgi:hypothetical protein